LIFKTNRPGSPRASAAISRSPGTASTTGNPLFFNSPTRAPSMYSRTVGPPTGLSSRRRKIILALSADTGCVANGVSENLGPDAEQATKTSRSARRMVVRFILIVLLSYFRLILNRL